MDKPQNNYNEGKNPYTEGVIVCDSIHLKFWKTKTNAQRLKAFYWLPAANGESAGSIGKETLQSGGCADDLDGANDFSGV